MYFIAILQHNQIISLSNNVIQSIKLDSVDQQNTTYIIKSEFYFVIQYCNQQDDICQDYKIITRNHAIHFTKKHIINQSLFYNEIRLQNYENVDNFQVQIFDLPEQYSLQILYNLIITNYNKQKYLLKLFNSIKEQKIFNQTDAHYNVIFGDDCSTDNSIYFTIQYFKQQQCNEYFNVQIIQNIQNLHILGNRLSTFEEIHQHSDQILDYTTVIDADDFYTKQQSFQNATQLLKEYQQKNISIDILKFRLQILKPHFFKNTVINAQAFNPFMYGLFVQKQQFQILVNVNKYGYVPVCGQFVKSSLVTKILKELYYLKYMGLYQSEDKAISLVLFKYATVYYGVDIPISYYVMLSDSVTHADSKSSQNRMITIMLLRNHFLKQHQHFLSFYNYVQEKELFQSEYDWNNLHYILSHNLIKAQFDTNESIKHSQQIIKNIQAIHINK